MSDYRTDKSYKREAWIRRERDYWKMSKTPKYNCYKGEIYEIDFGENVGSELSGRHLGLVIQDSNPYTDRVLIIPLSSKIEEYNSRDIVEFTIGGTKITSKASIVVNETRYLSKLRIFARSLLFTDYVEKGKAVGQAINLTEEDYERYSTFK